MKRRTKRRINQAIQTVTAGIVGSILTLTVTLNAPFDIQQASSVQTDATAQEPNNQVQQVASSHSLADMIETKSKAIVGIVNQQQMSNPFMQSTEVVDAGSGSGIIFRKEGDHAYIATNNHVIEQADEVEVSFANGETTMAEVIGTDALTDLAVLRVDAEHVEEVLPFGDSDSLRTGDQVIAIGNPLGLEFSRTVTQGIASATNRSINVKTSAGDWEFDVIQTDAAINPGNSGGALLNQNGELIGINSLKIAENGVEGLGFAIPTNVAEPIVEDIISFGKVERPYLGIALADLDQVPQQYIEQLPDSVDRGVIITQISPNAAAAKAGLKAGDIITAIDHTEITNSTDLRKHLYSNLKIGDETEITLYRNGEKLTLSLLLEAKDMM